MELAPFLFLFLIFYCHAEKTLHTKYGDISMQLIDIDEDSTSSSDGSEESAPKSDVLEINLSDLLKLKDRFGSSTLTSWFDEDWPDFFDQHNKSETISLEKWRRLVKDKMSDMISTACLADLMFWLDTVTDYVLAQNELAQSCPSENRTCSCATNGAQAIIDKSFWAMDVLDSMGRISAGVLKGNLWMLGDFEQCTQISVPKNLPDHRWEGRYSRVDFFFYKNHPELPFLDYDHMSIFGGMDTALNILQLPSSKPECDIIIQVKLGTCFPKTCSKNDVQKIAGYVTRLGQKWMKKRIVCAADVAYHEEQDIRQDTTALLLLFFLGFVFAVMAFATLYDHKVHANVLPIKSDNSTMSFKKINTDMSLKTEENGFGKEVENSVQSEIYPRTIRILMSFSLISNAKKIFDTTTERGSGRISCLHGVRALSILWVILAHSYSCGLIYVDNVMTVLDMTKYLLNHLILNATLAVDTFFLLSGTLVAYLWLKATEKSDGANLLNTKSWIWFYLHRYIRLTPVYAVVLFIEIFLIKYTNDGPLWTVGGFEPKTCSTGWWTNLVYINNFIDLKKMCMVWSWYVSNDMQFFFFSPPILIALWINHVVGLSLIGLLLAGSTLLRGLFIISNESFPPLGILFNDFHKIQHMEEFTRGVYIKPYCRCGPYLVGLLLGFILFRCQLKANLPKRSTVIGWIVATCSGLVALFGVFEFAKTGFMGAVAKFFYGSSVRVLWASCIAWIIFSCTTGNGGFVGRFLSSKKWRPISRLTYCAYLVHPILLLSYYSTSMKPIHYSGHFQMLMYFFGHVVLTFLLAFLLSCAFEAPVIILEREFFNRHAGYGVLRSQTVPSRIDDSSAKGQMSTSDTADSALNIKLNKAGPSGN